MGLMVFSEKMSAMNAAVVFVVSTVVSASVVGDRPELRCDSDRIAVVNWRDGTSVLFAKNGYMVLKRKGRCLADCGLYYRGPKHKRCGYQLRRTDQNGSMEGDHKQGRMEFSDILYEQISSPDTRLKFREILKYSQSVTIEAAGLLVRYRVQASQPLDAGYPGVYVHLPVRLYRGARVGFFCNGSYSLTQRTEYKHKGTGQPANWTSIATRQHWRIIWHEVIPAPPSLAWFYDTVLSGPKVIWHSEEL